MKELVGKLFQMAEKMIGQLLQDGVAPGGRIPEPTVEIVKERPKVVDTAAEVVNIQPEPVPDLIEPESKVVEPEVAESEIVEPEPNSRSNESEAHVSVVVNVQAPTSVKVDVTVNVEETAEDEYEREWHHRQGCDGIRLSDMTKYHYDSMGRPATVNCSEFKAIGFSSFNDMEMRSYDELSRCDDLVADGFAPSRQQICEYYQLCHACDRQGIEYNRRDRPETHREYQLAIKALRRILNTTPSISETPKLVYFVVQGYSTGANKA